jgi:hypothetical protein
MSDETKPQDSAAMPPASAGSTAWIVSRAWPFSAMTIAGQPAKAEPGGPERFILVFNTRAEAVAWYGKDDDSIQPLTLGDK